MSPLHWQQTPHWSIRLLLVMALHAGSHAEGAGLHYRPADHDVGDVHPYFETCRVKGAERGKDGDVGYATSPDLAHWTLRGHLLYPGNIGEPECPQMFELGGQWYLLASIYDRAVGRPSYWVADTPAGPWRVVGGGCLDGKDLCAAQVAFDGKRLLMFGWIPLKPASPGKQHWGGHLALPREVYRLASGQLATRLPAGMAERFRGRRADGIAKAATGTAATLPGRYDGFDLEVSVTMPAGARRAGVAVRTGDGILEIALERGANRLTIGTRGGAMHSELPLDAIGDGPMRLHVIAEEDMIEVFLGDRYSLAARTAHRLSGASVGLFGEGNAVRFESVRLYPLQDIR